MTVTVSYSVASTALSVLPDGQLDFTQTANGGFAYAVSRSGTHQDGTFFNSAGVSTGSFSGTVATGTNGSIAQLANGNFIVVSQDANSIVYTIYSPTGSVVTATTDLGQFGTSPDIDADIVALDNGGWAIAETAQLSAGANGDLKLGVYTAAGVRTSVSLSTSTTTNDTGATLTKLTNGNIVIAWTRSGVGGGNTEIWYAIYSETGGLVRSETLADATGTINRNVSAVALANGGFALTYEDNESGTTSISLARFNSAGIAAGRIAVTSVASAKAQITRLSSGMLAIAAATKDSPASNSKDRVFLVSADASTLLTPGGLATVTGGRPVTDEIADVALAAFGLDRLAVAHTDTTAATTAGETLQVKRTSVGDAGNDTITGDDLVDIVDAGGGTNIINGGRNNDVLTGAAGWDNAIYSRRTVGGALGSARTEFTIGASAVTDTVPGTFNLGTDSISGIDALTFDDSVNRLNLNDGDGNFISDILYRTSGLGLTLGTTGSNGAQSGSTLLVGSAADNQYLGAGDIDRSGTADVIRRNRATGAVSAVMLDAFGGTLLGLGTVALDWRAQGISDLTGEGTADVIWRNASGLLSTWIVNANGSIASTVNIATVGNEWQLLATNDLNDDGKADFIWRNSDGTIAVWLMNGGSVIASGTLGTAGQEWRLEGAIDFNGDRKADLLFRNMATEQLVVWRLNGTSVTGAATVGVLGATRDIWGLGDFNGDGRGDILFRDIVTGDVSYISLDPTVTSIAATTLWGTGMNEPIRQGTASATSFFDFTAPQLWQDFDRAGSNRTTRFGSVDALATSDIIWRDANGQIYTWSLDAAGAFASSKAVGGTVTPNSQIAGVGDFNGDGRTDILFRNLVSNQTTIWFLNNGTLASAGTVALSPNLSRRVDSIGDVNNDGKDDIVWRDSSGAVRVTLLNGSTVISDTQIGTATQDWQIVGAANVDGIAGKDIIFRNVSGQVYYWNTNGVAIGGAGQIGGAVSSDWVIAGLGDTNFDGIDDIIWRNAGSGAVLVWTVGPGGSVTSYGSPGTLSNDWQVQATGDFNGDGRADILWRKSDGALLTWFLNGLANIGSSSPGTAGMLYQTAGKSPLFAIG